MRRWMLFAMVGQLALGGPPAFAQLGGEPALAPTAQAAELFRSVNFRIVSGRLIATGQNEGMAMATETQGSNGLVERLSVDLSGTKPTIDYERHTGSVKLSLAVSEGASWTVSWEPEENSQTVPFTLSQSADSEGLSLTVGPSGNTRTLQAPALWHLLILEPALARKQLIPLLEMLRPRWHLAAQVTGIESALVRGALARRQVDRVRLERLVAQLASPRFVERQRSERELAALGPGALLFLAGLDRTKLDAEQWDRVQTLLSAHNDPREDTVDRAVTWLASDPQIWLAIFERSSLVERRAAAAELKLLSGAEIELDADAEPDVRAEQLARLRTRLLPAEEGDAKR